MQCRRSVRLCLLAAAHGHVRAQTNLGDMFRDGQGVEQDYAEAVRLYHLAAAQGDAEAQTSLGSMFWRGDGTVVYNLVVYTRAAQALRQRTLPPRISKLILK